MEIDMTLFPLLSSAPSIEVLREEKKMRIRRLRLDDDDEDGKQEDAVEPQPQPQPQTFTHQAPKCSSFHSEPIVISDDDFVDVPDDLSPPSPSAPGGSSVSDYLRRLGLGLKRDWLAACLRELQGSVRGFEGFDVAAKSKLCFQHSLFPDLNFCGSGVLPPNVDSMHLALLPGPYVLQVDEIINISCPLRSRYQQAPPGLKRCLKLSMTDGIQRVFGTEYRPIKALEVCAPSDLKEVPGSSILKALSTLRKQGFSSLPHYYLRAGSTLLARVAFHFADPCYGGLAAAYGPQFQAYSIMPSNSDQIHHGTAPVRIPLPTDLTEEPIYVNSKQYHAILRRRECRAKLEAHNRLIKARKPYLHESRHLHALKRARGIGGRFLNTKKLQESKLSSSPNHGLNVSSSTCLNLSGNMPESKMHHHIHQVENYRDGASTTSCSESDVTYASNRNGIFQQQQELGFRLCSYPAHTGRNMQDYTADKGGGVNHRRLSVLM